jgi:hypothetical protein
MRISTLPTLACSATLLLLAACSTAEEKSDTAAVAMTDTAAAMSASSPAEAMRGRWNVRSVPVSGDTSATRYLLDASGDTASWTITFEGRTTPVRMHVIAMGGDSVVTRTDEFDSARRSGMRVVSTTVMRIRDGQLVGTSTARYKTTRADSVLMLNTTGTRAP